MWIYTPQKEQENKQHFVNGYTVHILFWGKRKWTITVGASWKL